MSNTYLVISDVTREIQRVLHEKATFIKTINRQFDDRFGKTGAKIGETLQIRMPNKYTVRTGRVMNVQDSTETAVTLTVATQKGVDLGNFTSADMALSLDDFSDRIIKPAVSVLVSDIEADVLQGVTQSVANTVGTAGTTPASLTVWGQARQKLNESLAPMENRCVQLSSKTSSSMVNAYSTLFNPSNAISKQYLEGYIGRNMGFDWYENERILRVTNGSDVTGTVDETTVANGDAEMTVTGFTGALAVGQIFTVAGVYDVHPETKQAYSHLKQFTALAGTSTTLLKFSPAVYSTGALKNVSAMPSSALDSGTITPVGSASTAYPYDLAYQKDLATFVTADLPLPKNEEAMRKVMDGISFRLIVNSYDAINDIFATRLDVLYGYKTLRPELGCRVIGL